MPLFTVQQNFDDFNLNASLTAHFSRGSKCSCQLWVHIYLDAFLLLDIFISDLHLLLDPLAKDVSENRMDHVAEPLLRNLVNLLFVWQVEGYCPILFAERTNVI